MSVFKPFHTPHDEAFGLINKAPLRDMNTQGCFCINMRTGNIIFDLPRPLQRAQRCDKLKEKREAKTVKNNKKKAVVLSVAGLLSLMMLWTIWGNTALEISAYTVTADRLPEAFDGYRIAHISDLHNATFGKENSRLLELLRKTEPDIIAITGDLLDSRNADVAIALAFAEQAMAIAPCYYVPGNHESRVGEYERLKEGLISLGVTVLEGAKISLDRGEERICVAGVSDPSFQTGYPDGEDEAVMNGMLRQLGGNPGFTILLSHRPELMNVYAKYGVDLVLSGHAHGGQFRLPFIGGLVAPNQGFFPEYDAGLYRENGTQMVVSRGIGKSIIPLRFNNRPEIVLIQLKHKDA